MTAQPDSETVVEVTARAMAGLDLLAGNVASLGIALSGGGDSMALLHLAHAWAAQTGVRLGAAIIDHGLRPESAAEARFAAQTCDALGVPAQILHWQAPESGNLLEAAREGRADLIAAWARGAGIEAVALGHSSDDLAETLIMRLMRGAGLAGLSAMADRWQDRGMIWLRPLLECSRAGLRKWLIAHDIIWIDDPTNDDLAYDRVRIRKAIADLGLDPAMLARSARNLARAHDALAQTALSLIADARVDGMTLSLPLAALLAAPSEIRRHVFVAALGWVTGARHPPRQSALDHLIARIAAGERANLAGVILTPDGQRLQFAREVTAASRALPLYQAGIWDQRFVISVLAPGQHVAALPGTALPGLFQGGSCLGPAPARPLRDLDNLRQAVFSPRLTENQGFHAITDPDNANAH